MTREEAIRTYVENLSNDERVELIQHMNAYDGCFEDCVYYEMDLLDDFLSGYTPLEIARMICFGDNFSPNNEYFRFNAYGNLESADWCDVKAEAEDLVDAIITHLVNDYDGDTPWPDLDALVEEEEEEDLTEGLSRVFD